MLFYHSRAKIAVSMKVRLKESTDKPPHVFMRDAGYARHIAKFDGELSYVRRVTGEEFPRFHIYVDENVTPQTISIHLDQKGVSYDGFSAHNGEYEGPIIMEELLRLRDSIGVQFILLKEKR